MYMLFPPSQFLQMRFGEANANFLSGFLAPVALPSCTRKVVKSLP